MHLITLILLEIIIIIIIIIIAWLCSRSEVLGQLTDGPNSRFQPFEVGKWVAMSSVNSDVCSLSCNTKNSSGSLFLLLKIVHQGSDTDNGWLTFGTDVSGWISSLAISHHMASAFSQLNHWWSTDLATIGERPISSSAPVVVLRVEYVQLQKQNKAEKAGLVMDLSFRSGSDLLNKYMKFNIHCLLCFIVCTWSMFITCCVSCYKTLMSILCWLWYCVIHWQSKENYLQDLLEAKSLTLTQTDRLLAQYRTRIAQYEAEVSNEVVLLIIIMCFRCFFYLHELFRKLVPLKLM